LNKAKPKAKIELNNSLSNILSLKNNDQNIEAVADVQVLKIPLNWTNILTILLIVVLCIIGTIYIWILSTKKRCKCKLCLKEYELDECIGSGGFGAVYIVHKNIKKL
jgi:hypothetical protein